MPGFSLKRIFLLGATTLQKKSIKKYLEFENAQLQHMDFENKEQPTLWIEFYFLLKIYIE